MLAMNNEGFPLFKRTCSAQIVSMACLARPKEGGLLLWALKKCLLNGYTLVVLVPSSCSTTGVHLLDLLSRSPPYLRPFHGLAQDCSVLLNRGTRGD